MGTVAGWVYLATPTGNENVPTLTTGLDAWDQRKLKEATDFSARLATRDPFYRGTPRYLACSRSCQVFASESSARFSSGVHPLLIDQSSVWGTLPESIRAEWTPWAWDDPAPVLCDCVALTPS